MRWPRKVYKLGDRAGNGSKVKIINQLLAGVHIAAAAEAMALGLREGVDAAALYEVITHSAGNSWMFENRMAHVLAADYTPLSAVDIFVKDLGPGARHRARDQVSAAACRPPRTRCSCRPRAPAIGREDDAAVIKIFPGIELPAEEAMSHGQDSLLGCIADDFTGATDLANNLVRGGMRAVQTIGVPDGALDARGRRGRGRAEVAHHCRRPTRWRSRSRRCAGCARRARSRSTSSTARPSIRTAARQHRPGDRRAARCAARRGAGLHDRLPGLPREPAHGLQGPPVRRRRAAQRQRHAPPSADADDRRQPGARAAGADAAARSGSSRTTVVAQGAAGDPRALRGAAAPKASASPIVDAISNDDLMRIGAGAGRACRW